MSTFVARMTGAARLEAKMYEEVEADVTATGQAVVVIVLSSVATAIGLTRALAPDMPLFVAYTTTALAAWLAWSALVYLIGVHLLPEPQTRATVGEVLRTTGFAATPGIFRILGVVPVVGPLLFVIGSIWMLATMILAIRQALDYRHVTRALIVCLVGWLLSLLFAVVIGIAFSRPVW